MTFIVFLFIYVLYFKCVHTSILTFIQAERSFHFEKWCHDRGLYSKGFARFGWWAPGWQHAPHSSPEFLYIILHCSLKSIFPTSIVFQALVFLIHYCLNNILFKGDFVWYFQEQSDQPCPGHFSWKWGSSRHEDLFFHYSNHVQITECRFCDRDIILQNNLLKISESIRIPSSTTLAAFRRLVLMKLEISPPAIGNEPWSGPPNSIQPCLIRCKVTHQILFYFVFIHN